MTGDAISKSMPLAPRLSLWRSLFEPRARGAVQPGVETDHTVSRGEPVKTGVAGYQILQDVPALRPALDFERYARALCEIIEESPPQFTVGLFGGWGSGKSTLMEAVEAELNPARSIAVRFSAWRYEREEHLIIPLLDTIRDALLKRAGEDRAIRDAAVKTATTVGKVVQSLIAGVGVKVGLPGALEFSLNSSKALEKARQLNSVDTSLPRSLYFASFTALQEAFTGIVGKQHDRRIVVFVDDLDRCLPEGALSVLEAMKLFFDFDGFVFVVGLDRDVIEAAIEARYAKATRNEDAAERVARIEGSEYIKKLFQVPFSLFPIPKNDVKPFLKSVCENANLPADQRRELVNQVRRHLEFLITDDGLNPREIKRFVNSYTLIRKLRPNLERRVILALETIYARPDWETVKRGLLGYRQLFIEALKRRLDAESQEGEERERNRAALADLDPDFELLPTSFLEYVSEGQPGAGLLKASKPIDVYIYAGEAARSSGGTRASHLVAGVTGLRGLIESAASDSKFRSRLLAEIEVINETLRELTSKASSAYLRSAAQELDDMRQHVTALKSSNGLSEEARADWVAKAQQQRSRAAAGVTEWLRLQ